VRGNNVLRSIAPPGARSGKRACVRYRNQWYK